MAASAMNRSAATQTRRRDLHPDDVGLAFIEALTLYALVIAFLLQVKI